MNLFFFLIKKLKRHLIVKTISFKKILPFLLWCDFGSGLITARPADIRPDQEFMWQILHLIRDFSQFIYVLYAIYRWMQILM